LVFNSKAKSTVKVGEKCNFCRSVQSAFQQAEMQCSGHNFWHTGLKMLKFGEHSDHEIHNIFGIQHPAQKCKETWIKKFRQVSAAIDSTAIKPLQPSIKFLAKA